MRHRGTVWLSIVATMSLVAGRHDDRIRTTRTGPHVRRSVDGRAAAGDLRVRWTRGRGCLVVDRRMGGRSSVRFGRSRGPRADRAPRRDVVDHLTLRRWTRCPAERIVRCDGTHRVGRLGRGLVHAREQPHPDAHRALGRDLVDPREESERRPSGGRRPERCHGPCRRRRLGRRRIRAGRTRENAHRALGRHGVDGRPEPEQGSRSRTRCRPSRRSLPTTYGRWARGSPRRSTTGR